MISLGDHRCRVEEFFSQLHLTNFSMAEKASILTAVHIAFRVHGETRRKTGEPYIEHCFMVVFTLLGWGLGANAIIVGLLHDTIEDCREEEREQLINDIRKVFDEEILDIVLYLTKDEEVPVPKQIVEGAKRYPLVPFAKLADRRNNLITVPKLTQNQEWQINYLLETKEGLIPAFKEASAFLPAHLQEIFLERVEEMEDATDQALRDLRSTSLSAS